MGVFALQQRVRVVENSSSNLRGLTGTIIKIEGSMVQVRFDIAIGGSKRDYWFTISEIEDIENNINQEWSDGQKALEDYFLEQKHQLSKNEYIALELVKAWSNQQGKPADFDLHIFHYLEAVEKLKGD